MAEEFERPSGTERQSVKQLKSYTAPSNHYLVKVECDECISIIKHKNILEPPLPSVGTCAGWIEMELNMQQR